MCFSLYNVLCAVGASSCTCIEVNEQTQAKTFPVQCSVCVSLAVLHKGTFQYRFMDKMYSLCSEEALNRFVSTPRDFLLPPNPKIPCKVCIVGPPLSGKSTLAKSIAGKYNALVSIIMSTGVIK